MFSYIIDMLETSTDEWKSIGYTATKKT